jgi:hypothetical protein
MCGADFDANALFGPKLMSIGVLATSCQESDRDRNGGRGVAAFRSLAMTMGIKEACAFISGLR